MRHKNIRSAEGTAAEMQGEHLAPRRALCTFDGRKSVKGTKELLLTRVTEPCILDICSIHPVYKGVLHEKKYKSRTGKRISGSQQQRVHHKQCRPEQDQG